LDATLFWLDGQGLKNDTQQAGTAFVSYRDSDLDKIFSIQQQRVVGNDNTVAFDHLILHIESQTSASAWPVVGCWFARIWTNEPAGQIAARELELVRIKGALQRAEELSDDVASAIERHAQAATM
jgi:hypothetical protein